METDRLIIDPVRETDKEDLFDNIAHDRKVLETFICPYAETPDDLDISPYLNNKDLFAIRLKETGRLIGIILLFDESGGACEIGYAVGSAHWGRGYAAEAAERFIEYCFSEKGLQTVYASFFSGNEASRRVMEKCGMEFCRFSEKELTYLGVERDLTYYVKRNSGGTGMKGDLEDRISIGETPLTPEVMEALIAMSADWEGENSCYGYRRNKAEDIEGSRVFLARDGQEAVGYLFGRAERSERASSIMPDGTPVFEVEELYVKPAYRSRGVGRKLFSCTERAVAGGSEFMMVSTATKNWRAILHFYIEELGMEFWSARLFRKVERPAGN